MPVILTFVFLGVVFVVVGGLGWAKRLRRNSLVGLRTPSTMASDESWAQANFVAGRWLTVSGVVVLLGAVVAFVEWIGRAPATGLQVTLYVSGVLAAVGSVGGVAAGVIAARRSVRSEKAAR
ncbi:MAG: SdpI family protein [Bifidobacteriaceae bacterium]|jgi:uncharacterized membrane protein|nr:SdpI family protein [Bifidobacteriaceae bacterium]